MFDNFVCFVPRQVVVDFDAKSEFTLPFEGCIELVDEVVEVDEVVANDGIFKTTWRG